MRSLELTLLRDVDMSNNQSSRSLPLPSKDLMSSHFSEINVLATKEEQCCSTTDCNSNSSGVTPPSDKESKSISTSPKFHSDLGLLNKTRWPDVTDSCKTMSRSARGVLATVTFKFLNPLQQHLLVFLLICANLAESSRGVIKVHTINWIRGNPQWPVILNVNQDDVIVIKCSRDNLKHQLYWTHSYDSYTSCLDEGKDVKQFFNCSSPNYTMPVKKFSWNFNNPGFLPDKPVYFIDTRENCIIYDLRIQVILGKVKDNSVQYQENTANDQEQTLNDKPRSESAKNQRIRQDDSENISIGRGTSVYLIVLCALTVLYVNLLSER